MTNADEVLNISKDFKIWIIIVPLCSFPAYILDGIFFGTTHTAEIRKAMIFSTIFYFLTALILTSKFQNDGLWLALNLFLIMRALTLIYYYPNIERSVSSIKNWKFFEPTASDILLKPSFFTSVFISSRILFNKMGPLYVRAV